MIELLAGSALKAFFGALFQTLFGFLQTKQDEAAQRELGRSQVIIAQNKETANADQRVQDVLVNKPTVDRDLDDWATGKQSF
ncbi:MAG: hypothetical protein JWN75_1252 [Candidatus Saccharibacteria bacterium]|nr:hypothetical protein [Candidatus Saccharibacteria bacterium]